MSANGERLSAFGIAPGEGRTAALMVAHSFFMGLSTVFFETAASALFLTEFDKSYLPWVYLVAAAASTVFIGIGRPFLFFFSSIVNGRTDCS